MMESYVYAEVAAPAGAPLLTLLHGTGGDENDLLELGRQVLPSGHLVSPRGDVSEQGAPRFFRRLGMGIYDMTDLSRATEKLSAFIAAQAERVRPAWMGALGYSNGANVLASVLFAHPELVDRAVLMHPLIPFAPPPQDGLAGKRVLVTAGRRDPIAPLGHTEELAAYFTRQGASVSLVAHSGGHELRTEEITAARDFLAA
jgi:phospholipase/carboxylesterase